MCKYKKNVIRRMKNERFNAKIVLAEKAEK